MKSKEQSHLEMLAVFHYVWGGLNLLCGAMPLIYVPFGIMGLMGKLPDSPDEPPTFVWWFVIAMGVVGAVASWAIAILVLIAGRQLNRARGWVYCLVIAILECLSMPLGTILGVFTIIALSKPEIKALFDANTTKPTEPQAPSNTVAGSHAEH